MDKRVGSADSPESACETGFAPTCTVVICTRDRPELLDRCLEAVAQADYPRFDVLVVDNAPSDSRTFEVARRWDVRYVVESVAGLSRARNRGALECVADVIAYLDDDAVPEPGWLSALAREFEDPLVMAVAGKILPTQPEAAQASGLLGDFATVGGSERRVVDRETPSWFEIANFGGIGIGANMALRRTTFGVWPGFDVRLGRGAILYAGEEDHVFFSLIDRGYRVVYTPDAIVHHPGPRSPHELRAHHLKTIVGATGYLAFLLVEEPGYRRDTLKFMMDAVRGVARPWRGEFDGRRTRIVPRWRELLAGLHGLLLYARSNARIQQAGRWRSKEFWKRSSERRRRPSHSAS